MLENKLLKALYNLMWGEGGCGTYGVEEKYIEVFGRTTQGRRPHGKPMFRQEDNINMDLR